MGLEATVICMDNSEHMRNGDYYPTRSEVQYDALSLISDAKTQVNVESNVGLISMADGVKVLVTLTRDMRKILSSASSVKIGGTINLLSTLKIGQLALKNRQNKSQQQRLIIFIGSPIAEKNEELVNIAKLLKKNNISVDVIHFSGEDESEKENTGKLEAFVAAVDNKGNSHLVNVPAGIPLSDAVLNSDIISEGGAAGFGGFGGDLGGYDPELEMVLQASLEEERQRQAAAAAAAAAPSSGGDTKSESQAGGDVNMGDAFDEDEMDLVRAIEMSLASEQQQQQPSSSNNNNNKNDSEGEKKPLLKGDREEEQKTQDTIMKSLEDAEFVNDILEGLPGVDREDPQVKEAMSNLKKQMDKDSEKK